MQVNKSGEDDFDIIDKNGVSRWLFVPDRAMALSCTMTVPFDITSPGVSIVPRRDHDPATAHVGLRNSAAARISLESRSNWPLRSSHRGGNQGAPRGAESDGKSITVLSITVVLHGSLNACDQAKASSGTAPGLPRSHNTILNSAWRERGRRGPQGAATVTHVTEPFRITPLARR